MSDRGAPKARIRVELSPGVVATHDVRAKLVSQVAAQLGVDPHADCTHGDLEKSDKPAPKLRHRAPQEGIEQAVRLYEAMLRAMIDDIAAALK